MILYIQNVEEQVDPHLLKFLHGTSHFKKFRNFVDILHYAEYGSETMHKTYKYWNLK